MFSISMMMQLLTIDLRRSRAAVILSSLNYWPHPCPSPKREGRACGLPDRGVVYFDRFNIIYDELPTTPNPSLLRRGNELVLTHPQGWGQYLINWVHDIAPLLFKKGQNDAVFVNTAKNLTTFWQPLTTFQRLQTLCTSVFWQPCNLFWKKSHVSKSRYPVTPQTVRKP